MISFYQKQKRKIISAIIVIILGALSLWVKSIFTNKSEPSTLNSLTQNSLTTNNISDSAKQNNIQVSQVNSNTGDVNNETYLGDKNIYTNNTYNSTTIKSEKELLSKNDLAYFVGKIPKKSCGIWLFTFNQDAKSMEYANRLKNSMEKEGYKNVHVPVMIGRDIKPEQFNKIDIEMIKDSQNVNIQIYPITKK